MALHNKTSGRSNRMEHSITLCNIKAHTWEPSIYSIGNIKADWIAGAKMDTIIIPFVRRKIVKNGKKLNICQ